MANWRSISDLAQMLETAADEGRTPRLTPQTARLVALSLRALGSRPNRDDIARWAICSHKGTCENLCFACMGTANLVDRLLRGQGSPFEGYGTKGSPKPRGIQDER